MSVPLLFANNASSRLYAAIDAVTTSIRVQAGDGDKFPTPADGNDFTVTLEDRRSGQIEICLCTARGGDILTVVRAQEGTLAQAFVGGATVSNRITAGTLAAFAAGGSPTWDEIIGKPVTFPPTLPIPSSGVTNLDAKQASQDAQITANHNDILQEAIDRDDADMALAAQINTKADTDYVDTQNADQDAVIATKADQTYVDDSLATKADLDYVDMQNDAQNVEIAGKADLTYVDSQNADQDAVIATKLDDAPSDGKQYGRKNHTWAEIVASGGSTIIISDTPPPTPTHGTLWFQSSTGDSFIFYNDGDSSQWVQQNGKPGPPGANGGIPEAPTDGQQYVRQNASWALSAGGGGAGNPTGTVIWFAAASPPTGYVKANGQALSRTTYAALFAVIDVLHGAGDGSTTFNVPDLRGEFIRGWDDARGVDAGRAFASAQAADFASHLHSVNPPSTTTSSDTHNHAGSTATAAGTHAHNVTPGSFLMSTGGSVGFTNAAGANGKWQSSPTTDSEPAHTHSLSIASDTHNHTVDIAAFNSASTGGAETRPRNIALLPCIKI